MQTLNLDMTSGGIPPVAHCSQCDFKKPIKLVLHDGSLEYTIPDGATVMVLGRKHDNHPFEYDSVNQPEVVTYSGSEVTIYTTVQMTAAAGDATCEIRVTDSTSQIYSANFILDVEAMAVPQDNDISDMDMPLIIAAIEGGQTVAGIEEKITEAETILSNMEGETAESSANAKAAKTSEENAKTSETNAKASETASKASEEAAAASATAAKNSQTQAAGSATKAANQATAAATSAQNAANSESNAKASETAAKASETAAKASEEAAKASETAAKASETAAKASETAAATSETNAKASETAAKESEDKAKSYAGAAETSETHARESETNAKASEVAAAESEANAKTYMEAAEEAKSYCVDAGDKAKASEEAAAGSATKAAKSETAAKESEDKAKSYAGAAETSETHARESETNAKASETAAATSEANAKTYMEAAEEAKSYCVDAGDKAKTWAVGQTGTRDGEDTDNAKYYAAQAEKFMEAAEQTDVASLSKTVETKADKAEAVKSVTVSGKTLTVTKADGSTSTLTTQDTTYSNATATAAGLMSAADKSKLDGVESGTTKTVVDSALSSTSTNPVQNKVVKAALDSKADTSAVTAIADRVTTAESEIDSLQTTVTAKADKATTLAGYGITDAVNDVSIDGTTMTVTKSDGTTVTGTLGTDVNIIAPLTVDTAPTASGNDSIAIGTNASSADSSIAIGANSVVGPDPGQNANDYEDCWQAIAIGKDAFSYAQYGVAIGGHVISPDNPRPYDAYGGIAIGNAESLNSIAIGEEAVAYDNSTAIGDFSFSENYGIAIGDRAESTNNSIAVGRYSYVGSEDIEEDEDAGCVSVGKSHESTEIHEDYGDNPFTRRIINVKDPVNAQDAATKAYVDSHGPIRLETQTLLAGQSSVTFLDDSITDDSLIDVYASVYGVSPTAVEQSGTSVTVTFDAQEADMTVAITVQN